MTEINPKLDDVAFAPLEANLITGDVERPAFLKEATRVGLSTTAANRAAKRSSVIAANEVERQSALRTSYDYVVVVRGERTAHRRKP